MPSPEVSIVIPAYNMKDYLKGCLSSLAQQYYRNFEIIVSDDASEDGTDIMVQTQFPEVKIIRNHTNRGAVYSRNTAIKNANGIYIATLDADTSVDTMWLWALVETIKRDYAVGMCSCKILRFEQRTIVDNIGHTLYYDFSPQHIGMGLEERLVPGKAEGLFGVCLAGALIKKEIFYRVGFFDEDYGENFGDDEWSWRARLAGYQCVYVPAAIMYHHRLNSRIVNTKQIFLWERNRILSMAKYYTIPMIMASIWYSLKRFGIALSRRENKARSLTIPFVLMKAWKEALMVLPVFLRKRREEVVKDRNAIIEMKKLLCRHWKS